jgi:rubredoxin
MSSCRACGKVIVRESGRPTEKLTGTTCWKVPDGASSES